MSSIMRQLRMFFGRNKKRMGWHEMMSLLIAFEDPPSQKGPWRSRHDEPF